MKRKTNIVMNRECVCLHVINHIGYKHYFDKNAIMTSNIHFYLRNLTPEFILHIPCLHNYKFRLAK